MAWEKNILAHDSLKKNILALKVTEKNILARLKNPGPPWKSNGRSLTAICGSWGKSLKYLQDAPFYRK